VVQEDTVHKVWVGAGLGGLDSILQLTMKKRMFNMAIFSVYVRERLAHRQDEVYTSRREFRSSYKRSRHCQKG
jgi:hypothetical protein